MATQVQWRRGTKAQNDSFTGAIGEITVDTTNNELRIHDGSTLGGHIIGRAFPATTKMLFQQTAAPTGWTKDTTHNDKILRIVSGSVSSGGNDAFSTVFGAGKNTASSSPTAASHGHSGTGRMSSSSDTSNVFITAAPIEKTGDHDRNQTLDIASGGGSSAHTHGLTMDLQYVDIIIATKD